MSWATHQAAIYALASTTLSDAEKDFFASYKPWGFILFARNIENAEQLRSLTQSLKKLTHNPYTPILVDQEGGRVARLKPPLARTHPAADMYGKIFEQDEKAARQAARLGAQLIGLELRHYGITINCLPCLDVCTASTSDAIGDRAYGNVPEKVAALGMAAAQGLMETGILPVMKHLPGLGRGRVDSHLKLPIVETSKAELMATDFESFRLCHELPLAMTGHLKFTQLDSENVATQSEVIISQIIRKHIGFDGLLMSDDISMQALCGDILERSQKSLEAGCDLVLHCNGQMREMEVLGKNLPRLSNAGVKRAKKIEAFLSRPINALNFEQIQHDWEEIVSRYFPKTLEAV